jgi:hypothetical protein
LFSPPVHEPDVKCTEGERHERRQCLAQPHIRRLALGSEASKQLDQRLLGDVLSRSGIGSE